MNSPKPHILLAFANSEEKDRELPYLEDEQGGIERALRDNAHIIDIPLIRASLPGIESRFKRHQGDIAAFHFAGHGDGKTLELSPEGKVLKTSFAQGLAKFVGKYNGLKLVFLNACATREQIKIFHQAGVPLVIATVQPLDDKVGSLFAIRFYANLHQGMSIQHAFDDATEHLHNQFKVAEFYRSINWDWFADNRENQNQPYLLEAAAFAEDAAQATLEDWANAMHSQPAPRTAPPPPSARAPLGKSLYLLVNRDPERDTFLDTLKLRLKTTPTHPQAFLIHGKDNERPQSLADRFQTYTIRYLFGNSRLPVPHDSFDVFFPDIHPRKAEKNWHSLMDKLKEELDIESSLPLRTPKPILSKVSPHARAVFFRHYLYAEDWRPGMEDLLQRYIHTFWRMESAQTGQVIVLLFLLIYPDQKKGFSLRAKPERLARQALPDLACEECILIEELDSVQPKHLRKWRDKHFTLEPNIVQWAFDVDILVRIPETASLPMSIVEERLKALIEFHNNRHP